MSPEGRICVKDLFWYCDFYSLAYNGGIPGEGNMEGAWGIVIHRFGSVWTVQSSINTITSFADNPHMPHTSVKQTGKISITPIILISRSGASRPPSVHSQTFNNILEEAVAGAKLENQFGCKICYLKLSFFPHTFRQSSYINRSVHWISHCGAALTAPGAYFN